MSIRRNTHAAGRGPAGGSFLLAGTVVTNGTVNEGFVVMITGGRIAYAGPRAALDKSVLAGLEELDLPPGSIILPGLVDLHCHGAAGGDFPGGEDSAARAAVDFLHRSGTTTVLASLVTASREDLLRGLKTLRVLTDEGLIAGIHAEGPFLSHARCGAQDPRFLLDPDPRLLGELIEHSGGHLRTMTYAPELPGSEQLVRTLVEHGVTPSLGHTDADGAHLDPETVRMVFALVGSENVILVTDSMAATGLPDGDYELGPANVRVRGGEARLRSSGSLAGGTATLLEVVRRTIEAGVEVAAAVSAATAVPARILGLHEEVGSLQAGLRADVVVVDKNFDAALILRAGVPLPALP